MQRIGVLSAIKACLKMLLSALNASFFSVKENEKNSKDTDLIKNEDYDAGETLKKICLI